MLLPRMPVANASTAAKVGGGPTKTIEIFTAEVSYDVLWLWVSGDIAVNSEMVPGR